MLTTDGECRIGLSIGPICSSIARVSRNSSASGISFQRKARLAHVHRRNQRRLVLPAVEQAGLGLEGQRALAGFLEQQLGDAAHAVAAGARLRAVIVVDAHIGVGAGRARRVQGHQLVVGRAVGLRGRARLGRADRAGLPAHVDHHDLVAETVHLDECVVGERAHGAPAVAALYGQAHDRGNDCVPAFRRVGERA